MTFFNITGYLALNGGITVDGKSERTWKQECLYFKVLSQHPAGKPKKNFSQDNQSQG
jgi:hypothetical protein